MPYTPTKSQQLVLDYITQYIAEHGFSPSYREIAAGCDLNSPATVACHIANLEKHGLIRCLRISGKSRAPRCLMPVQSDGTDALSDIPMQA